MKLLLKFGLLLCPLGLTGCLQMLPAKAIPMPNNTYTISSQGNMFATQNLLTNKISKAASKVCPKGYHEQTSAQSNTRYEPTMAYANGTTIPVVAPIKTVSKVIQCD